MFSSVSLCRILIYITYQTPVHYFSSLHKIIAVFTWSDAVFIRFSILNSISELKNA